MKLPTLPPDSFVVTRKAPGCFPSPRPALNYFHVSLNKWVDPRGNAVGGLFDRYVLAPNHISDLPRNVWNILPAFPPHKSPRGYRLYVPEYDGPECRHILWNPFQGGWTNFRAPASPVPEVPSIWHLRTPLAPGWIESLGTDPRIPLDDLLFANGNAVGPCHSSNWRWDKSYPRNDHEYLPIAFKPA